MRRTVIMLVGMMAALVAVSGVAWAVTTIDCSDQNVPEQRCLGTRGDDEIIGTDKGEEIAALGGNDIVRAGRGNDLISDGTNDSHTGRNKNYGGPGHDRIEGALDAERHHGGSGDDNIADYFPSGDPDYISCGRGYDEVTYNEGVDKVASDCEVLRPYNPQGG